VGFDPDSSKAERTFKALVRQDTKLHKFLGEDLFTELLNCEEEDQRHDTCKDDPENCYP